MHPKVVTPLLCAGSSQVRGELAGATFSPPNSLWSHKNTIRKILKKLTTEHKKNTANMIPTWCQHGTKIYANTHQQVVQIMVAKTMRKIFKYYVFLKCKNFQIDRNGHHICMFWKVSAKNRKLIKQPSKMVSNFKPK